MIEKFKKLRELRKIRDEEENPRVHAYSPESLNKNIESLKKDIFSNLHLIAWGIIIFLAIPLTLESFGLSESRISFATFQSLVIAYCVNTYINRGWSSEISVCLLSLALSVIVYFI